MPPKSTRRQLREAPPELVPPSLISLRRPPEWSQELETTTSSSDPGERGATPLRLEPPGMFSLSRTRDAIHPYVEQDLKDAQIISIARWTASVFGLPPGRLSEWAQQISKLKWFTDRIVQQSLIDYCKAKKEKERYQPFVSLANRIIDLGRGKLVGVDAKYPVNTFCFADNHNRVVDTIDDHEGLGAHRKPDVLGLLRKCAKILAKDNGTVRWVDILLLLELKFKVNLLSLLNSVRCEYGLAPVDETGKPEKVEKVCNYPVFLPNFVDTD